MNDLPLDRLFAQNFIDHFDEVTAIRLEDRRNDIIKLVRMLILEFPFLKKLDLKNMTLDQLMNIVFQHLKQCSQCAVINDDDYLEWQFQLVDRTSFVSIIEMCMLLYVLFHLKDKPFAMGIVFENGNMIRHKVDDVYPFKFVRDNSVHVYNKDTLEHRFIMSVDTFIEQVITSDDNVEEGVLNAISKHSNKPNVLEFMTQTTGCNLQRYPELQVKIEAIKNKIVSKSDADFSIIGTNTTVLLDHPNP